MTGQLLLCSHPRLDSTLREVSTARAAADDRRDEIEGEREKREKREKEWRRRERKEERG